MRATAADTAEFKDVPLERLLVRELDALRVSCAVEAAEARKRLAELEALSCAARELGQDLQTSGAIGRTRRLLEHHERQLARIREYLGKRR